MIRLCVSLAASDAVLNDDGTLTLRLALVGLRGRANTDPMVSAVVTLPAVCVERIVVDDVPADRVVRASDLRQREQEAEDARTRPPVRQNPPVVEGVPV